MHTMTWKHTRTNRPMTFCGNGAAIWMKIAMIRQIHPNHPISIDGTPI